MQGFETILEGFEGRSVEQSVRTLSMWLTDNRRIKRRVQHMEPTSTSKARWNRHLEEMQELLAVVAAHEALG
ncbi:hypothetical protein CC2G_004758 [Coprinopsis cinerea AmutBmut pab1-1]|nr:hypothetical protein CC2G_004758 [Coprinopsis cinerea AmutBmut pab1-1]